MSGANGRRFEASDATDPAGAAALAGLVPSGPVNHAARRVAAPHPESEEGKKVPGLLEAYKAWQARQAAAKLQDQEIGEIRKALELAKARLAEVEAQPSPDAAALARQRLAKKAAKQLRKAREAADLAGPELEERASRKGAALLKKLLEAGVSKGDSVDQAWWKYRDHGGKLNRLDWQKALVNK